MVEGDEPCDDGNSGSADGCDPNCFVETGWYCGGEPSSCFVVCGDDIVAGAEECDDGNTANNDGCDANCFFEGS